MPSNLEKHAEYELKLLDEEPEIVEMYMNVVRAFSAFGHSGGSAMVAIPVITRLLSYENLSPLTVEKDEWIYHDQRHGNVWQSTRNSKMFSTDGGKTYFNVDEGLLESGERRLYYSTDLEEANWIFKIGEDLVEITHAQMAEIRALVDYQNRLD
jgi:hypothetical protein